MEEVRVEKLITIFVTNYGEEVIVRRLIFCTASSLRQFALDISGSHAGPAYDRIGLMYSCNILSFVLMGIGMERFRIGYSIPRTAVAFLMVDLNLTRIDAYSPPPRHVAQRQRAEPPSPVVDEEIWVSLIFLILLLPRLSQLTFLLARLLLQSTNPEQLGRFTTRCFNPNSRKTRISYPTYLYKQVLGLAQSCTDHFQKCLCLSSKYLCTVNFRRIYNS